MKLLGRGAFTKAYLMDNGKVFLKSVCQAKECMSMGWFPESYLFPIVLDASDELGEYLMEYLPRVKAPSKELNTRAYRLYKWLRKAAGATNMTDYHKCIAVFKDLPSEFAVEAEALIEAVDALTNYGPDICFEISPRNISKDAEGNLVLADVFFFMTNLRRVRTRK